MKNTVLFILVILLTEFSFSQTMTVYKKDQTTVGFQLTQIDSITFSMLSGAGSTWLLVFSSSRNGNSNIYSSNTDGTGLRQLTNGSWSDWGPRINPSRTKIVFGSNRTGQNRFYVMNIDGTNQQLITNNGYPGWADWTRDEKIIYSSGQYLNKVNADGTNPIQIATAPSGKDFTEIVTSRTADLIAVTAIGSWGYDRTIYLMNTDGTNMRIFVPDAPGVTFNGSFTPDGSRLAYSYDLSQHEETSGQSWNDHIFLINLDGTGKTDVSINKPNGSDDTYLAFTPDGQKIVFEYYPNLVTHVPDLWIMNIDGSGRTRLLTDGRDPNVR